MPDAVLHSDSTVRFWRQNTKNLFRTFVPEQQQQRPSISCGACDVAVMGPALTAGVRRCGQGPTRACRPINHLISTLKQKNMKPKWECSLQSLRQDEGCRVKWWREEGGWQQGDRNAGLRD
ncbi:Protein of unknown function [Gryllus bimaculatus]|nr:Protein of unknown function [Gryllus bimaculatus]